MIIVRGGDDSYSDGFDTTLLVVGNEDDLEVVEDIVGSDRYRYETGRGPVVIVGKTAMGTLERAGIETTLVDELEIVVASDREASVSRLRTAGANDVLSLPNVAARMISLRVFDRETMILGERVSIARVETADLETEELEHDERETIRDRTGCSVVGLEYDGHLTTDVQTRSLSGSDALVIAGSQTDIETFLERYASM